MLDHPEIVPINYHNNFPDLNDGFYLAARFSVNTRNTFYNVSGDPDGIINGFIGSSDEPTWEAYSTSKALSAAPIAMNAYMQSNDSVYVHLSNSVMPGVPVRLYVAIVESHIVMANSEAEGVPQSGFWDNVFRMMLPSASGTNPFIPTGSDDYTFSFAAPTTTDVTGHLWNLQNMTAVAFLQDVNPSLDAHGKTLGYPVEAIGVVSLADLSAVANSQTASSPLLQVFGMPSNPQIRLSLPISNRILITLSDLLGRQVRVLVDGRMPSGQTSVELSGSGLAAGCYVAHLSVDGRDAGHAMLVIVQ
jgi:hypothetical protein